MEERYVMKGQKRLRCGFTTGTCAAAAAKAAAQLYFTGRSPQTVLVLLPSGEELEIPIESWEVQDGKAVCAVRKDSGDDPDVTNGVLVYGAVSPAEGQEIRLTGGLGVGIVTKPGLEQPVGSPAINRVPRQMILTAVDAVRKAVDSEATGIQVEISIPQGVELAKRTYNPRLGIEGGISILGTTGIVEPMSEKALIDTIALEEQQLSAQGVKGLIVTLGNYGETYSETGLSIDLSHSVKCSNFIGEALDYAAQYKFQKLLLIGHIGKLVKVAAGIMNTHSHMADGRLEVLTAYAALEGITNETAAQLMSAVTTDEAIRILDDAGIRQQVMKRVVDQIAQVVQRRCGDQLETAVIVFSNQYGFLGQSANAYSLLRSIEAEQQKGNDQ